jgi:glycosyltransferase involved in cell wall biosynthesis
MTQPVVSIVVPSFNCEQYIRQTLQSVVEQTFTDWELIVVDDGSTDQTVDIASDIDPRIRVVQQRNARVCAARNRGFAESIGRFVCFMDHDDYWFPEKLARQVGWMTRMPELGVVYSNCIYWHAKDGVFPAPESMRPTNDGDALDADFTGWVYHQFMLDSCALTSSAMIRREALDACGLFDESLPYSEDWDIFLRLTRKYPFAQMTWGSTLYRQHEHQGSRVARPVDYRSELLVRAEQAWGLTGPDGTIVDQQLFNRTLARYRMEFGWQHLAYGDRRKGIQAMLDAWQRDHRRWRALAMAAAAMLGWRPDS